MSEGEKKKAVMPLPSSIDSVLGEVGGVKIYAHSVFSQCVLPVRSLPKEQRYYRVQHGNSSLMFQAGCFEDDTTGKVYNQEIPSGAKARLLFFSYYRPS